QRTTQDVHSVAPSLTVACALVARLSMKNDAARASRRSYKAVIRAACSAAQLNHRSRAKFLAQRLLVLPLPVCLCDRAHSLSILYPGASSLRGSASLVSADNLECRRLPEQSCLHLERSRSCRTRHLTLRKHPWK